MYLDLYLYLLKTLEKASELTLRYAYFIKCHFLCARLIFFYLERAVID